jgi:uncharacterized surface protein with fasciclin (FAS1) repeats
MHMKAKQLQVSLSGLVVGLGLVLSPALASAATGDIVDKAVNTPALSTLVTLVTDANLVGALQGAGPFTVFAPTNDAFAAIPTAIKKAIERDPANLTKILTYHVLSGTITSTQVPKFAKVSTLEGGKVIVRNNQGSVSVNSAKVIIADVTATNGVVHVIDKVLIPPSLIKEEIERLRQQINELRELRSLQHGQHND